MENDFSVTDTEKSNQDCTAVSDTLECRLSISSPLTYIPSQVISNVLITDNSEQENTIHHTKDLFYIATNIRLCAETQLITESHR